MPRVTPFQQGFTVNTSLNQIPSSVPLPQFVRIPKGHLHFRTLNRSGKISVATTWQSNFSLSSPIFPPFLTHISQGRLKSLSRVRLFATPWTVAYQALPSVGFSRQEYWSGLPFPVMRDIQMKGWSIHWGRRALGIIFPAPIS